MACPEALACRPGSGLLLPQLQTDWITQCFYIVWTEEISLNNYTVFNVWGFQDTSIFKEKKWGKVDTKNARDFISSHNWWFCAGRWGQGEFQERISWGMLPFESTEEILRNVGLIIYKKLCPKSPRKKVWSTISYEFWYFLC